MAAYAALASLSHIVHQTLHPPPLNKIVVDREQIEFLQGKVDFLLDFLETYPSRRSEEIEGLQRRIADAAYEAEDIIESDVVEQILATDREKVSTLLCDGIQTVLEKFLSIGSELMKIRDHMEGTRDLRPKSSITASSRHLPSGDNTMVGFDEHMIQVMDTLATDECRVQIIPIVGMGGIGKTTLARNVYNQRYIQEYFYIRAWVTISQEYNVRQILLDILHQINNKDGNDREIREDELGEQLHRELFGRKYLIVMDDMWDIQAWDDVRRFLPANNNGSRILVTTRLSNLALDFESCSPHEIDLLNEAKSWDLLREKVFGKEDCPVELEEIGRSIAERCGGLPLALVVIGGLLAKSGRTKEHWKSVEEDVASVINDENDGQFLKILSLSYDHLPINLKPCFLYLAVFPEDYAIRVFKLIRLWVAEGFIRPSKSKSLEEVAEEFLEDLIDRNLILVYQRGKSGKVKCCSVHDLIRDLCRREAQKDKFLHIILKLDNPNISPFIESERRLSIHSRKVEKNVFRTLHSKMPNRSLVSNFSTFLALLVSLVYSG